MNSYYKRIFVFISETDVHVNEAEIDEKHAIPHTHVTCFMHLTRIVETYRASHGRLPGLSFYRCKIAQRFKQSMHGLSLLQAVGIALDTQVC